MWMSCAVFVCHRQSDSLCHRQYVSVTDSLFLPHTVCVVHRQPVSVTEILSPDGWCTLCGPLLPLNPKISQFFHILVMYHLLALHCLL